MRGYNKPPLGRQVDWNHPLSKDLILGLLLNEGNGTLANDITGRGSNGVLTGCTWTGGKYGTALNLNGSSDYVRVPHHPKFNVSSFSLVALIKRGIADFTNFAYIISKWTTLEAGGLSYGMGFNYADEKLLFDISEDGGGNETATLFSVQSYTSITDWYHIVATHNQQTLAMKLYVNGKLDSTGISYGGPHVNVTDLTIGAHGNPRFYFNGLIDHALKYNRELSVEEIEWLYREPYGMIRS